MKSVRPFYCIAHKNTQTHQSKINCQRHDLKRKGQTTVSTTQHRKLNTEQHETAKNGREDCICTGRANLGPCRVAYKNTDFHNGQQTREDVREIDEVMISSKPFGTQK